MITEAVLRVQRDTLWMILDDIDTLDDAAGFDDGLFRELARKLAAKRHKVVEGHLVNPDSSEWANS